MAVNKFEKALKGIGRRKTSTARVAVLPGTGKFLVNGKTLQNYFPNEIVIQDLLQPLTLTNSLEKYDVYVKVLGGGFTGQAGAIRLGLVDALLYEKVDGKSGNDAYVAKDEEMKKIFNATKLNTRDRRVKERKKINKHGARRSHQFSAR
ncbi:MAG: 30S ribosomal protein S9 [Mycoplasmataceae bacterium]|jgi:small subunit ribosomal protein S9|nr:30S ribosomal protein S9 [Mycoplasmataceae bacterium]